jgi:hypothetical protein
MNNMYLWKVAKYKAVVRNLEGYGVTKYPITEAHYEVLKIAIRDKSPFIWLEDLDWNNLREINAKRDIKNFEPISYGSNTYSDSDRYVCGWGVKHLLIGFPRNCNCYRITWLFRADYQAKLKEEFWYKFNSPAWITRDMIEEFKLKYPPKYD